MPKLPHGFTGVILRLDLGAGGEELLDAVVVVIVVRGGVVQRLCTGLGGRHQVAVHLVPGEMRETKRRRTKRNSESSKSGTGLSTIIPRCHNIQCVDVSKNK